METRPLTLHGSEPDTLTREAIATLRRHPDFAVAASASARGSVDLHQSNRLMNWMLSDRAKALFPFVLLYLDATAHPDDPRSGLTVSRMKAHCADTGLCSPGSAAAFLALLQIRGFLEPAPMAVDRRVRRLVPTAKLQEMQRARLQRQFGAIAIVIPDIGEATSMIGRADFERAFWRVLGSQFIEGLRVLDYAPDLTLFAERGSGMVILLSLMLAGEAEDTMPPARPVPVSVTDLSRRFKVSRSHILRLLREAETAGLLTRSDPHQDKVALQPRLVNALFDMLAAMFLLLAGCARMAVAEVEGERG